MEGESPAKKTEVLRFKGRFGCRGTEAVLSQLPCSLSLGGWVLVVCLSGCYWPVTIEVQPHT